MINIGVLEVTTPLKLPYSFIGSAVRGAFGKGLKRVSCTLPRQPCSTCPVREGCAYFRLFEEEVPLYRLQFRLGGELKFKVFLFERGIRFAPMAVKALQLGLERFGIGGEVVKKYQILYNGVAVATPGKILPFIPTPYQFLPSLDPVRLLKTETPIRLKSGGLYLRDRLEVESLLRSIWYRRSRLRGEPVVGRFPFNPDYKVEKSSFHWVELIRYSERQRKKLSLGGVFGELRLEEVDSRTSYLLRLGEVVGVGEATTFGLGHIVVE
jgi:hypothetical protein